MELFETKRLRVSVLDKASKSQISSICKIYNDKLNMKYIGNGKHNWSLKEIFNRFSVSNDKRKYDTGHFAIVLKKSNELIGEAAFFNYKKEEKTTEIGFIIDNNKWGKGFGTEICTGMINYLLNRLNKDRVIARVNSDNSSSLQVCINSDMKQQETGISAGKPFHLFSIEK